METIKKHRKKLITLCVLVLCVVLVLCIVPVKLSASKPQTVDGKPLPLSDLTLEDDVLAPEGMKRAVSDGKLTFYINPVTADFSVYDIRTGNYWNSNLTEQQAAQSKGTGTVKSEMRSQILLTYYDEKDILQYFNSYEHSAKLGNVAVAAIENGVAVTYKIGDTDIDITMLPAAIKKDKFESLIANKITDSKHKALIEKYYILENPSEGSERKKKKYEENFTNLSMNTEYYFLDLYAPNYVMMDMYNAIFRESDYTTDDLYADNEAVGYTSEIKTLLQVQLTVEYTLENGEFKVRIPAESISVPDNIFVTEISLLPFFATAGVSDNGYMIVPDGSGAMISLNNGRINTQTLRVPIYGTDTSISKAEQNISETNSYMPIYAMVKNNSAYLAIIESGDTCASVYSKISGMTTDFNQLYSGFNIRVVDPMVIKTNKGKMSTNVYQEEYFDGDITVRYTFYGENDANYSALAREYRSYLIENGTLKEADSSKRRLNIGLTGKIIVQKNIVGIDYQAEQTVTSFKQAQEIVTKLYDAGVTDVNVIYSSWYGGGLATALPNNVSPASNMGGKKSLSALNKTLGDKNLTLGASVFKLWQGYPKINPLKYANRLLTNKTDKDYRYSVATNMPYTHGGSYYTLDARYVSSMMEKYLKGVSRLDVKSVSLDDLGSILSSNFEKGNQLNRREAKSLIVDALSKADTSVTLTAPNIYAAGFADMALEVPTKASQNHLCDSSIPFLQIVLSGCVDYTVPSVNGLGTPQKNILEAVETGSQLYFDWIYASDEEVTDYSGIEPQLIFSRNYENWIVFATEKYLDVKERTGDICTGAIMSHEKIADGVYRTDWEKGSVIVNYNDNQVIMDGIIVPANDFTVVKRR